MKFVFLLVVVFGVALSTRHRSISSPPAVDVAEDASRLRKAMKGFGTSEDILIDILTHRYYNTRLIIANKFKSEYGLSLWDDVHSETSGNFRMALKGLVMTEAQFLAEELHHAMRNLGTDEDLIINVLMMTLDDYDTVQGIKQYYESLYEETLQERIESETGGYLKQFLVAVLNRPRFNSTVDQAVVSDDLATLKGYLNEDVFPLYNIITLFTKRSAPHLKSLREAYYQDGDTDYDYELEDAIDEQTDHHIHDGLVNLLTVSLDPAYYLAYELKKSMDGLGTDEGTLTRIIVTRADKDLELIKKSYMYITGNNLTDAVHSDTSGDYRKTLTNLIN